MKRVTIMLGLILLVAACKSNATDQLFSETDLQTAVAGTIEAFSQQSVSTLQIGDHQPSVGAKTSETLSVIPTPTLIQLSPPPLDKLPTSPNNIPYPIQFEANGTYQNLVVDAIPAGGTSIYSVNAKQGQVMSVATWRQNDPNMYIPQIQIKGADETVVCPEENRECKFWRGILPSSQDYYITFAADPKWDTVSFMMRVAINPPGIEKQFFQYWNISTGLSLTYNDAFAPTGDWSPMINYKIPPDLILQLIDPTPFENTNLSEVNMTIGSTSDAESFKTCLDIDSNGIQEQIVGKEIINGYEFLHTRRGGVAAGSNGETDAYRMVYDHVCYEVTFVIHSVNIGNLTGDFDEFDRGAIFQHLNDIFSSFSIQ